MKEEASQFYNPHFAARLSKGSNRSSTGTAHISLNSNLAPHHVLFKTTSKDQFFIALSDILTTDCTCTHKHCNL